ncbi:MAG: hypothetical protein U0169_10120 [Polyangiaceae bacterium]
MKFRDLTLKSVVTTATVGLLLAACTVEGGRFKNGTGEDAIDPVTGRPVDPGASGSGGAGGSPGNAPVDAGTPVYDSSSPVNNVRPDFQMKSAAQVANAIEVFRSGAHLGHRRHAPGGTCNLPSTENGRCGFLPPRFAVGADIVASQSIEFDGDESALKTGTRPDQLTLPAMSAMQHVANVVGANCIANGQTGLCKCDSQADAAQMIARCLPNIRASAELTAATSALAAACASTSPDSGQGHAIASLVASFAFMKGN